MYVKNDDDDDDINTNIDYSSNHSFVNDHHNLISLPNSHIIQHVNQ